LAGDSTTTTFMGGEPWRSGIDGGESARPEPGASRA
jgi:hypothetical protein